MGWLWVFLFLFTIPMLQGKPSGSWRAGEVPYFGAGWSNFHPFLHGFGMLFGIWYALVTLVPQNVFFDVKNILERFR